MMMFATKVNVTGSFVVRKDRLMIQRNGRENVWPPVKLLMIIDHWPVPILFAFDPIL